MRLVLIGLCWLAATSLRADPLLAKDEADWLHKMSMASRQLNYSGTVVYQSGGRIEISQITHVMDKDGEHERLESMNAGKQRMWVRNNEQVWLYADGAKVRVGQRHLRNAFPALLPDQMAALKENYVLKQAEEDNLIGFHAHTLVFQAKDGLRYSRKMWAENQTGLLLKAVVLDARGHVIEQHAFTQLKIGGDVDRSWILRADAVASSAKRDCAALTKGCDLIEDSGWQVDAVPPGFRKMLEMRRNLHGRDEPTIHQVFSDGLAGISVFIEKMEPGEQLSVGLSSRGAVHIYNRQLGEHLITVVGEVPARAVMEVADSVRYSGE